MAAPDTVRLFVAIDPPEAVRTELSSLAQPMRGVSWTSPHQYHLTLRFIGDVTPGQSTAIELALAPIQVESFILPVGSVGSFPPKRSPRVIWVGVGQAHPRLFQLRQRVDDALLRSGLSGLDVRRFEPHFTLGRCGPEVSATEVVQFIRRHRDYEAPPFRADAFTLYQSELRAGGAVHTALLRVPLL